MSAYSRSTGLAGILAGVLIALAFLIHPLGQTSEYVSSSAYVAAESFAFVGFAIALLGLCGIQARQSDKAGVLGAVGFLLLFLGIAFMNGVFFVGAVVFPFLARESGRLEAFQSAVMPMPLPIFLIFVAGGILFGISIVRARALPRGAGVLLALSVIMFLVSIPLPPQGPAYAFGNASGVAFGISFLWLGYALWKQPM